MTPRDLKELYEDCTRSKSRPIAEVLPRSDLKAGLESDRLTRRLRAAVNDGSLAFEGRTFFLRDPRGIDPDDRDEQFHLTLLGAVDRFSQFLRRGTNPPPLVLSGGVGVGKSTLVRNIASHLHQDAGGRLLFLSFDKNTIGGDNPCLQPVSEIPLWDRIKHRFDYRLLHPETQAFLAEPAEEGVRADVMRHLPDEDLQKLVGLLQTKDGLYGIPSAPRTSDKAVWDAYRLKLDADLFLNKRELSELGAMIYDRSGDLYTILNVEEFGEFDDEQQLSFAKVISAVGPASGRIASPVSPNVLVGDYLTGLVKQERFNPRMGVLASSNYDNEIARKLGTRINNVEMPDKYPDETIQAILISQLGEFAVSASPGHPGGMAGLLADPQKVTIDSALMEGEAHTFRSLLKEVCGFNDLVCKFAATDDKVQDGIQEVGRNLMTLNASARPDSNTHFIRPLANWMSEVAVRPLADRNPWDSPAMLAADLTEKMVGNNAFRTKLGRETWDEMPKKQSANGGTLLGALERVQGEIITATVSKANARVIQAANAGVAPIDPPQVAFDNIFSRDACRAVDDAQREAGLQFIRMDRPESRTSSLESTIVFDHNEAGRFLMARLLDGKGKPTSIRKPATMPDGVGHLDFGSIANRLLLQVAVEDDRDLNEKIWLWNFDKKQRAFLLKDIQDHLSDTQRSPQDLAYDILSKKPEDFPIQPVPETTPPRNTVGSIYLKVEPLQAGMGQPPRTTGAISP